MHKIILGLLLGLLGLCISAHAWAYPQNAVPNNTSLRQSSTATYNTGVWRTTFGNGNGAPPLFYLPGTSACSISGGDNGSQVPSADGKCWLAVFASGGADVQQWGANPDAVPGPIGAACAGIVGTDNTAAFNAAINWALANSAKLISTGPGTYRVNSEILINNTLVNYFNTNKRNWEINITNPIVECGTKAAVRVAGDSSGSGTKVYFAALIGSGAGSSAPTPGSYNENVGLYLDGSAYSTISVGSVSDFTYDVLVDGSYANNMYIGTAIASYKAIYYRDGAPGTQCPTCPSAANTLMYSEVGGVFTSNTDPNFAQRQARSSYWGLHLSGSGSGNYIAGGAAQFTVKGTTGVNVEIDSSGNYVTTWMEGHQGANGLNLVVGGSLNVLNLSGFTTGSTNVTQNINVTGQQNQLWGQNLGNASWGTMVVGGGNYENGTATAISYTPTLSCGTGTLTTASATGRYRKFGTMFYVEATVTITTNGTCAGSLNISLPGPGSGTFNETLTGRNNTTGGLLFGVIAGTATADYFTAQTTAYPGGNGTQLSLSGWYAAD